MKYIKISAFVFLISLCLLLVGLLSEETKYGFIAAGVIVHYIGLAMLIIGAFKRGKKSN
jgi:hypothetical protein